MLKYCPDKCKTHKICDEAVDSYLLALKFVPNCFVSCKMIEKGDNAVFSNDNIVFDDIDSDIVTFFSNDIDLNSLNFNCWKFF